MGQERGREEAKIWQREKKRVEGEEYYEVTPAERTKGRVRWPVEEVGV